MFHYTANVALHPFLLDHPDTWFGTAVGQLRMKNMCDQHNLLHHVLSDLMEAQQDRVMGLMAMVWYGRYRP